MKSNLFDNEIWRIEQAADYLHMSKGHIYNLVYRREIPFLKKGKFLYFRPLELMNWLLEGNQE